MAEGNDGTAKRPLPSKHTFVKTRPLLEDFFKVDEYKVSFEKYDNTMSDEQRLLVFERGDSAAALLFDPASREVILVEQFRLAAALRGGEGWILETVAGIIEPNETVRHAIISEIQEETGYHVTELIPIARFFATPGGSTERIHLFYAEVQHRPAQGGGLRAEGEDIRTVRMPVAEFFSRLRGREIQDAKLIIAAQWLKDRRSTLPAGDTKKSESFESKVIVPNERSPLFFARNAVSRHIGYLKGDISWVHDVEAWVNPLSTDMMLDGFADHTVSARIRLLGAEKDPKTGGLKRDTIGDELRRKMGKRDFVKPATYITTSPGALGDSNKVKKIVHVAATRGYIGKMECTLDTLDRCVDNVLAAVSRDCTSVLIPMIGTGQDGFTVKEVAPRLIRRAIQFYKSHPGTMIKRILFLPYSEFDAAVFAEALAASDIASQLEPPAG